MSRWILWTLLLLGVHTHVIAQNITPQDFPHWSWQGPLGTFDRSQLQRGFQVFKQICSSCHSASLMSYRQLGVLYAADPRKEDIIKAIASEYKVADVDEDGQPVERMAIHSDKFASPFPNEKAARAANNGAYPVDLSLITKARADGANYVYLLLTGYAEAPPAVTVPAGMHYNKAFHGHFVAMAPPLTDAAVTYLPGQPQPSIAQMAQDVTAFLVWVSEPELESRKQQGVMVILFLLFLTILLYLCNRRIWSKV